MHANVKKMTHTTNKKNNKYDFYDDQQYYKNYPLMSKCWLNKFSEFF